MSIATANIATGEQSLQRNAEVIDAKGLAEPKVVLTATALVKALCKEGIVGKPYHLELTFQSGETFTYRGLRVAGHNRYKFTDAQGLVRYAVANENGDLNITPSMVDPGIGRTLVGITRWRMYQDN